MIEYGCQNPTISEHLKAWVYQNVGGGDITVCGLIADGSSREITSSWSSPYANESLGEHPKYQKIGGIMQYASGKIVGSGGGVTSKTSLNSVQVWDGSQQSITLNLKFIADIDPVNEVMKAIEALEQMASPEVGRYSPIELHQGHKGPAGRVPDVVKLCIGHRATFENLILKSVSTPIDNQVDRNGNMLKAEVSLQLEPVQMLNRSDIPGTFKSGGPNQSWMADS